MSEYVVAPDKKTDQGENPYVKSFRDLIVYRKAFRLARDLYKASTSFPRTEQYGLTDQMRRSSRSVGAQIAEAWGKRFYERSFVAKLVDADAEQMETQHWVLVAMNCKYLSRQQQLEYRQRLEEIGRMLGSMIQQSSSFCNPEALLLKESISQYIVESDDDAWLLEDD